MNPLLETSAKSLISLLRTRTGWFGLGPSYGEILIGVAMETMIEKHQEKSVVRGAEKYLAEVDKHQNWL